MSLAFSSFNNRNCKLVKDALGSVIGSPPNVELTFFKPHIRGSTLKSIEDFKKRIEAIRNCFNLDASEMARRVLIDAFLSEALPYSKTAIVTAEYTIDAARGRLGHGRLDYIACSIEGNPDKSNPLRLLPSIVIEAKKDLLSGANDQHENALWQLLSELVTLVQMTTRGPRQVFVRGVTTDGRYWNFVELSLGSPKQPYVVMTGATDIIHAPNHPDVLEIQWDQVTLVEGLLQHWFRNISNDYTSLFPR